MARSTPPVVLNLRLSGTDALGRRIARAILAEVADGRIAPGDHLPSTRSLATALGVGRRGVVEAYDELAAAGHVDTAPGGYTVVRSDSTAAAIISEVLPVRATASRVAPPRWDLRPGRADPALVSATDWRRCWRAASIRTLKLGSSGNDYAELRSQLVDYLRTRRGIAVTADEVVIVPGVGAALRLLTTAAGLGGHDVAFEEPGYLPARLILEKSGARIRPVAVDGAGLDPAAIPESARAVYVTPAHQFPLGSRLTAPRRAALLRWAIDADAVVIEDDYDGEFRYDVPMLPALRSALGAEECVAYIGTASKMFGLDFRVAWMVPPRNLLADVGQTMDLFPERTGGVDAAFLAEMIRSGALSRHMARVARTYRSRRAAFLDALDRHMPTCEVVGMDAGLHVVVTLPPGVSADGVVHRARANGVAIDTLGRYCMAARTPVQALVAGYALLPETKASAAVTALASAVGAVQ